MQVPEIVICINRFPRLLMHVAIVDGTFRLLFSLTGMSRQVKQRCKSLTENSIRVKYVIYFSLMFGT